MLSGYSYVIAPAQNAPFGLKDFAVFNSTVALVPFVPLGCGPVKKFENFNIPTDI